MVTAAALSAVGAVIALRRHRARAAPGHAGRSPRTPATCARHVRRSWPAAYQCGLLRAHVGAVRPMDLAVDVRAGGQQERGHAAAPSTGIIAFSAIGVAGVAGSLLGGWASDRFGRRPAAVTALVISAACCIASPLFFAAPTVVLGPVFVGVGRRRHRRLRCLLHLAERDADKRSRRDRTDRTDRRSASCSPS